MSRGQSYVTPMMSHDITLHHRHGRGDGVGLRGGVGHGKFKLDNLW